jgi:tRNA A37 methylthiotransferase MiaB
MVQRTVYIETYGCSANQNNSEILAGILASAGFIVTSNPELAEILIINTCIVKSKTESKIKRRIQDIRSQFGDNKLMIITGCMPETDTKNLKKISPNSIMLGTHCVKDIKNLIRDFYEKKLDEKKQSGYLSKNNEVKLNVPKKPNNPLISIH